ncbi:MAG: winged helix-turn-helix transcriptional regulator [Planctomycetes bacterium]|nr:winged helix-turn-helix transcriptional regulator [Planctomycetota bacterium]
MGVVETVGGQIDATVIAGDRLGNLGPGRGATGTSILAPARLGGRGPKSARLLGTALAAMGHPVRIKILTMLLDGPGVYRSLQKVTGLKPGPLYHHVNQLRLAGLIGPKQRDLYELTRAGRNLLMVTLALEPLLKDRRLRPQAKT